VTIKLSIIKTVLYVIIRLIRNKYTARFMIESQIFTQPQKLHYKSFWYSPPHHSYNSDWNAQPNTDTKAVWHYWYWKCKRSDFTELVSGSCNGPQEEFYTKNYRL